MRDPLCIHGIITLRWKNSRKLYLMRHFPERSYCLLTGNSGRGLGRNATHQGPDNHNFFLPGFKTQESWNRDMSAKVVQGMHDADIVTGLDIMLDVSAAVPHQGSLESKCIQFYVNILTDGLILRKRGWVNPYYLSQPDSKFQLAVDGIDPAILVSDMNAIFHDTKNVHQALTNFMKENKTKFISEVNEYMVLIC